MSHDDANRRRSIALSGRARPPEVRQKISDSLKGKKLSDDHRNSISRSLTGKSMPEEIRMKISDTRKKAFQNGSIPFSTPGEISNRARLVDSGYSWRWTYRTSGHRIVMDFFNPITKTNIEYDGPSHSNLKIQEYDRWRDKVLSSEGVTVIRIKE